VIRLRAEALSVPLREPFVIATARMDATRAVLVTALVEGVNGYGEAAALPPVTTEDQPELLEIVRRADPSRLDRIESPVARAAIECAILDAEARRSGVPLARWLSPTAPLSPLTTDVTIPIAPPAKMAANARAWRARGFECFKVKVGRSAADDREALRAIHEAAPGAKLRIDANEGFSAEEALSLVEWALGAGLALELFEQPCRRADVDGMARVTAGSPVPVVADESVRTMEDLEVVLRAQAARGVNLKLAKHGGLRAALEIGRRAKREGLGIMAGAMVETKLGLTAMAHVVCALGGVDWVDLDTALLLVEDPFVGGLIGEGPSLSVSDGGGLAIRPR
jgi:L-alanine-DL-glutamate epimerase-like enolase superfamily enzyme